MRRRTYGIRKQAIGTIIFIAIILIVALGSSIIFEFNDHTYTITVTDKERITEGHTSDDEKKIESKYIVFGDDPEGNSLVFENTDSFLRLKFNSSNVQGMLKEGHTYEITVVGYRVPWLSWYENIIKVKEVE